MKIALGITYDGSTYCGWQRQKQLPSIQACLEHALSKITNESVVVHCAGRTDAGVHAIGQVVHFNTQSCRINSAWTLGVNENLPADIAVRWAIPVADDFHARFSALSRQYRYIVYNHQLRPVIFRQGIAHCCRILNTLSMTHAATYLLGENDFTSFRASNCRSGSPWRNIYSLNVIKKGYYVIIDIKANSFLQHMVRNIVGSLLEIGYGRRPASWMAELLKCRDRTKAGPTAPARGLYLVSVEYAARFSLPDANIVGSELLAV